MDKEILDFKTSPKEYRVLTMEGEVIHDIGILEFFIDGQILVNEEIPVKKLLQYTGLNDKNNKKIREGDIVSLTSYPNEKNIGYVTYGPYIHKNEGGRNGVERLGFYIARNGEPIFCDNGRGDEIEVIGNVFENSDLLQ